MSENTPSTVAPPLSIPEAGTSLRGHHWQCPRCGSTALASAYLIDYSDKNASTDDNVRISMLEVAYHKDRWGVAGRLSGWKPEDNDGSSDGISPAVPNPGLALSGASSVVPTDQRVARIQLGGQVQILDVLLLKAEWFKDDYKYGFPDRGFDVSGLIVSLNALFP